MITQIFGENCKRAKVIDVLLTHPHNEYTKSDISKIADVHRTTLNTFIDELIEVELLEVTRNIGNAKMYKINLNSPITQALDSFQNQLIEIETEKQRNLRDKTFNAENKIKQSFKEVTQKDFVDNKLSMNPTSKSSVFKLFNKSLNKFNTRMSIKSIARITGESTYNNNTSKHKLEN
jgi:hypothetical protein